MSNGAFSGEPRTEWLTEAKADRDMRMLNDFWYDDPSGRRWMARAGSIVNGASIPEALWSTVGSPFTGDYRRASVVHDVACATPEVLRRDADEMFYWACLAGGCSLAQAKVLYLGVRIGSWASTAGVFALAEKPERPRLPNDISRDELLLQAKYTLVADRLSSIPDDFELIEAAVDEELGR